MEEDLLALKLPESIIAVQHVVQARIRSAIQVHRESKRLLDIARRGVEIAIEQDEAAAIEWMEKANPL